MTSANLTQFNMNSYVRVQLTDFGRKVLHEQHEALLKSVHTKNPNAKVPFELHEDAEGWSRWQLWFLMAKFGPYMSMVTPLLFASDILLEV